MAVDLLSLDSVARFAEAWNARCAPLHVLINNAGIFSIGGLYLWWNNVSAEFWSLFFYHSEPATGPSSGFLFSWFWDHVLKYTNFCHLLFLKKLSGIVVIGTSDWLSLNTNVINPPSCFCSYPEPQKFSKDGYEEHLQVNHLAPALLSVLLLPSLIRGSPSRIVNLNSIVRLFLFDFFLVKLLLLNLCTILLSIYFICLMFVWLIQNLLLAGFYALISRKCTQ